MKTALETESINDAQLVERSRDGDRDAFGRIVQRYQSLVCALTYSACGNLQTSEDLAQVTFITAWCELRKLQEPSKLKSWLCGIARNVTNNSFRKDKRTPTAHGEMLDEGAGITAEPLTPRDHMISKEEEAILWRSLGELPTTYREPLVLFYRQHQSVAEVADALDVSEDVVRQRLSRGRTMLTEKVTAFIEGALKNSAPGAEFAGAVLAALPMGAGAVATIGTAAKGTAAKGGLVAFLAASSALFVVLFGWTVGFGGMIRSARTPRERRFKIVIAVIWVLVLIGVVTAETWVSALGGREHWSFETARTVWIAFWTSYAMIVAAICVLTIRRLLAIRKQDEQAGLISQSTVGPNGRRKTSLWVIGLYVANSWWLIDLAWKVGDKLPAFIFAAMTIGLIVWEVCRTRGKTGDASMRMHLKHMTAIMGVTLLVLNWRLGVWVAARTKGVHYVETQPLFSTMTDKLSYLRVIDPAGVDRLLPMWIVHLLTLALVIWVGVLLAMTKPKARE